MVNFNVYKDGRWVGNLDADNQYQAQDIASARFGRGATIKPKW